MNVSEYFEVQPDFAVFRPVGSGTLEERIEAITQAIVLARDRKQAKLLVDVSGLAEMESPSVTARYWLARKWADAGEDKVIVAVVARAEVIDWQKFGVTAARNAGLISDVFTAEADAVAWLGSFKR